MEVKEQLKEDEKLVVSIFKLEKFFNKYKKHLIAFLLLIVSYFIYTSVKDYLHTKMLIETNKALNQLLEGKEDKKLLEKLKENKELFNLYMLYKATSIEDLKAIDSKKLEAIKEYKIAVMTNDIDKLESYLLSPEYKILKDDIRVVLIRDYLEKNDRNKANVLYKEINVNSDFYEIAKYLMHYGIVK